MVFRLPYEIKIMTHIDVHDQQTSLVESLLVSFLIFLTKYLTEENLWDRVYFDSCFQIFSLVSRFRELENLLLGTTLHLMPARKHRKKVNEMFSFISPPPPFLVQPSSTASLVNLFLKGWSRQSRSSASLMQELARQPTLISSLC